MELYETSLQGDEIYWDDEWEEFDEEWFMDFLMPLENFIAGVQSNMFTEWDGTGYLAVEVENGNMVEGHPLQFDLNWLNARAMEGYTHVFWYNK